LASGPFSLTAPPPPPTTNSTLPLPLPATALPAPSAAVGDTKGRGPEASSSEKVGRTLGAVLLQCAASASPVRACVCALP
jgi:hypothetical protein